MVARIQPGNSFEHAAFDCAEEKVSVCAVVNFALPELVDFAFVFRGGGPDAEFYGLGERGVPCGRCRHLRFGLRFRLLLC